MPDKLCDARLVERARRGDEAATNELLRRIRPAVFTFVRAIVQRDDWAEDATQLTLMHVVRDLGEFNPARGEFRSWVYSIAKTEALMMLRCENRHPSDDLDEMPESEEPAGCGPGPEDDYRHLVEQEEADELLATLKSEERVAVTLFFFGDMNKKQIAAIIGKSEHTARYRILCGLAHMKAEAERRGMRSSGVR